VKLDLYFKMACTLIFQWSSFAIGRSTLIKNHILKVCAIALKAVSIILNSSIPFILPKLWNLINTEKFEIWFDFNFRMYIKFMPEIFVWNYIFQLLLQIIDDLVVFSKLIIYFKVIGISFYFVSRMKLAPNSNISYIIDECWN
jgi:hypothetical protein